MRSGGSLFGVCVALLLAASPVLAQDAGNTVGAPVEVEANAPAPRTGAITKRDIDSALETVRKDPNLSAESKIRSLRWAGENKPRQQQKNPGWLAWFAQLFSWFAQNGRFLFWGVLVVLAAMLIIYLSRLVSGWRLPERSRRLEAPSFVRDLDIRPESLPADIGVAARKLWDASEHRAALSLLYRGLLSRLVHVHGVPIKDSTTEGDCLALAAKHLVADHRKAYVTTLVRAWQRAVYGGESLPTEIVYTLCDEFAAALDAPDVQAPGGAHRAAGASA